MDRDNAIQFALSRRPESIGMARLCQELLADVAGKPVTAKAPVLVPLRPYRSNPGPRGKCNNPWGAAGKPR
ncbi:MAG: hypothetical protein NBV68_03270 [Erythrobacter sp.]|uniref:hypothetical protein n=1 Tax=Erythrobacter sp. TaxID=1042 RepID=UPI0025E7C648|nr:hypothetical protein [Erythrobacter sp.]MCL9998378.1 hypothetical protein [Erythrobacter sp.]